MLVAIFLPPGQTAQIKSALGARDEIRAATSWEQLEWLVRTAYPHVVVFDPTADGRMEGIRACALVRSYPGVPFVAYVPLDAPFMREIAAMANEGLQDVVLYRSDDSPLRLRATLDRVSSNPEVICLMEKLQPLLAKMPTSLVNTLFDALRNPEKYPSAENVARGADLTLSSVYRSFRTARLKSPKSFVLAARVFRGFLYLRDAEFTIRDASEKVGYAQPRIFAQHTVAVLGDSPSKVRNSLDGARAIELVASYLRRRP